MTEPETNQTINTAGKSPVDSFSSRVASSVKDTYGNLKERAIQGVQLGKSGKSRIKQSILILLIIIVLIAVIMSIVVATSDDSASAIGFMSTMWVLTIISGVIYWNVGNIMEVTKYE